MQTIGTACARKESSEGDESLTSVESEYDAFSRSSRVLSATLNKKAIGDKAMAAIDVGVPISNRMTKEKAETVQEIQYETWRHWPMNWSAIWVGTLASLAAVLVFGLVGIAVEAHLLGPDHRVVDLKKLGILTLVFSVCGAFFSFAVGGWIAGKIAGILHSEPAMLHGAISWLVSIPLLIALVALGAGSFFGGWFGGLSGSPSWAAPAAAPFEHPDVPGAYASPEEIAQYKKDLNTYHEDVRKWKEDTPKVTRNSALGAVTALLLGLVGSVIGGWMACGEPMNFTHYRTRKTLARYPA
jgi:hypothetical protein